MHSHIHTHIHTSMLYKSLYVFRHSRDVKTGTHRHYLTCEISIGHTAGADRVGEGDCSGELELGSTVDIDGFRVGVWVLKLLGSKLGEDVGMGVFVDGCWVVVVGDSVKSAIGVNVGSNEGAEAGCGLDGDGDGDGDGEVKGVLLWGNCDGPLYWLGCKEVEVGRNIGNSLGNIEGAMLN